MLTKDKAIELLHANMDNVNLRRHCYAVGIALDKNKMRAESSPT